MKAAFKFFYRRGGLLLICLATAALAAAPLTEKEKIASLLRTVETSGVKFIRNGVEYGGKQARAHMELKLSRAGGRIKTAEHFITYLGTKSSMTGRKYYIKLSNGKKVPAADWLRGHLRRLESSGATPGKQ